MVLHFVNPALVETAGRRWVCGEVRDFRIQATVAGISHAVLTWASMSLRSGSTVEKHLPSRSKLLDLWPGWLHVWWPCYYCWSDTLWQFERCTNFPLQPSGVVDPIQVKKNITDSRRKSQLKSYPWFSRENECILCSSVSFKPVVLRTTFFRVVALFGVQNTIMCRCDFTRCRSDEA
jgi:hypothetical protein